MSIIKEKIVAGGSTNIYSPLNHALNLINKLKYKNDMENVILLTDG